MTERPRAILFDLDGTLIHYRERKAQLLEIVTELRDRFEPLTCEDIVEAIENEFGIFWSDPGQHKDWSVPLRQSRRGVCSRALGTFQHELGDRASRIAHDIADAFHERRESEMLVFPGAFETIDALRREGIRLALITNGPRESQRKKVRSFDLEHRFEHIQIEEEFGAGKPEEHVYRNAMSVLGVTPKEVWMVGDHLVFDVGAPQRLGVFGIWHDGFGQGLPANAPTQPDRVISRLKELLE